jgi:hypothetical protein
MECRCNPPRHSLSGCSSWHKTKCQVWLPRVVLCQHWVSKVGNNKKRMSQNFRLFFPIFAFLMTRDKMTRQGKLLNQLGTVGEGPVQFSCATLPQVSLKLWPKMSAKKLVLPKNIGKKLIKCTRWKLQMFVITNICKLIFVTLGRMGTWWEADCRGACRRRRAGRWWRSIRRSSWRTCPSRRRRCRRGRSPTGCTSGSSSSSWKGIFNNGRQRVRFVYLQLWHMAAERQSDFWTLKILIHLFDEFPFNRTENRGFEAVMKGF